MIARNVMRRVNRGIVLAVILVVGLISYLIYDNARFGTEKIAIQNMITEYAKAAGDLNILPAQEQKAGESPSNDAIRKKLQENRAVISKYLTEQNSYNSALDHATRSLDNVFSDNTAKNAYVTECEYTITSVKNIKKTGPKHATAEITVQVQLKTIGKPSFFTLISNHYIDEQYYGYGDPHKPEGSVEIVDTKRYTYTWEFTMYNATLVKQAGKWKFAGTGGLGYNTNGKLVEE
ncbi:MAG TPA: hypothetical protein DEB10_07825 [Ruminococcaceae bacterium]|nr:hypothetical protein [Oscillospiraceae bacterium]HCA29314.1 hypothetical protein [Oscillospiraceae bacterium]